MTITLDTIPQEMVPVKKSYTKQIIVNGIISLGLGTGAGLLHLQGNQVYDDYTASTTMIDAHNNWERVRRYDLYRNLCVAGSAVFFIRTIYYYIKNTKSSISHTMPLIDIDYAHRSISIGVRKHL
jgi:hypothetical protein